MKTNRAVIVQCRLSSTRLPGKALKDLSGKPVLAWVLSSMKKVSADKYFLATDADSYDSLKPICDQFGFECFKGDLNDVLKRFCDLIKTLKVKTIIRATADNPFLFTRAAELSAKDFEERNKNENHCDYLTWTGLPHGSGVEIFSAQSLLKAAEETSDPYDHEHVGPALYNHKDKYKCEFIQAPSKFNYPQLRTTIDTYSDYLRAIRIAEYLLNNGCKFGDLIPEEKIIQAANDSLVKNPVVLIPSVKKGHGSGHLHRCLSMAINQSFFVYIPENKSLLECDSIVNEYLTRGLKRNQIISKLPDESYKAIFITDDFKTEKEDLDNLKNNKMIISIDEGATETDFSDYLLDIIPSISSCRKVNLTDVDYINKANNIRDFKSKDKNISQVLICLGGEDPAGLSIPAAKAISSLHPEYKITLVESASCKKDSLPNYPNIEVVEPIPNLKEELYKYDLVITHYGLTAFESRSAGCAVILLPTTNLHKELAKKYNFSFVEDSKVPKEAIAQALKSPNLFNLNQNQNQAGENKEKIKKNLPDFIKSLCHGQKLKCPVCDKDNLRPDKIVSRNPGRTYRRCQNCGLVYISWTLDEDKKYQKTYFFEEYKKQYGKTYQEDFENIKSQGLRRLHEIKSISPNLKDKNILDIGCAYGPFLSAALDYKLNPYGTDISEDAVKYVQNQLGIPASLASFPQIDISTEFSLIQFDIVTMWYVIEHFKNLDSVLSKVSSIVKKGGIFAFSTPSGEGISAKSNKDYFYSISPADHYSVWEPSRANNILKKYGFEVVKIVSTGHHPERFPSIQKKKCQKGSFYWNLIDRVSKSLKLGDTMEIYCKKIK